jgi:hypothetical protein
MKKITYFLASLTFALFIACSGSETYRGKWKAMDAQGSKFEIDFGAANFSVTDSTGKEQKYGYNQKSINIADGVETSGITLDDDRFYQITFPNSKDENVGLIKDGNGMPLYTIGRKDYVNYNDLYKLD